MTHEAGVERPGVHGRLACAGTTRGTARTGRLGDVLRRRREELGLSLEDVAARLDLSAYTYGTWERSPDLTWSDEMVGAMVVALEMDERLGAELIRFVAGRDRSDDFSAPVRPSGPVPPSSPARRPVPARPAAPVHPPVPVRPPVPASPTAPADPADPETGAYLRDYAALMDAVPLPSMLFDRHWDVAHANPAFDALFRGIGPHPTAMPQQNFLRFALFHPDAPAVLAEHETGWCLPLMAQLACALERDGEDRTLQAIRDEIAQDPIMDAAYACGLPHWVRAVGAAAVDHDGAVRRVNHPDPRWGRTDCRIVDETPKTLQEKGFTRVTLVLRENPAVVAPGVRRGKSHLRAVSGG
ncbi:helix-turn-helix domain-containing protein [Streptomyces sp. NPDC006208]|uniref:helix-turn-helix domain-containing protein n=1 Tax=Streptomyces sp. NPDC006208 TaxID=3156734 RepID=UPI0033AAA57A